MKIQIVMHLVGQLLLLLATIMLVPFGYGLLWEEPYYSFIPVSVLTA